MVFTIPQALFRGHFARKYVKRYRLQVKREANIKRKEQLRRAKEAGAIVQWMEYLDSTHGVFYYYNPVTSESRYRYRAAC